MPGAPTLKMRENQKKRKELLAKKKYVKPEAKSKAKIVKEKKETNKKTLRNQGPINKNIHPNAMKPKDRKKYEGPTLTDIIKGGINKITGGGKAVAALQKMGPKIVPKKKPLSPAQKKKDTAIMKAEDARRAKGKSLKRRQDSAAIMKAERASRAKSKKRKADTRAADTRDAKRGGFITAKAAATAGRKANEKVAANKKRRSDELVSRGRK